MSVATPQLSRLIRTIPRTTLRPSAISIARRPFTMAPSTWPPPSFLSTTPSKVRDANFTVKAPPPTDTRPIVISGPSGVGKGTLFNLLFERHPDTFALSVSHTTRDPRPGESDSVNYHFVTMGAFESLIAEDGFVEHAKFGGNRYGTSKATIREQSAKGKVVILDIEMEVSSSLFFASPEGQGVGADVLVNKHKAQLPTNLTFKYRVSSKSSSPT